MMRSVGGRASIFWLVGWAIATACGATVRDAEPPPTVPTAPEAPPPSTASPPPPSSTPTADVSDDDDELDDRECTAWRPPIEPGPGTAAATAYLAAIDAWNARDLETYYAHFAPTLVCFHGTRALGLDEVRRTRTATDDTLGVLALSVVRASDDEVLLHDVGVDQHEDEPQPHDKAILMRRDGERWLVAAETQARTPGCLDAPVPDTAFARRLRACAQTEHAARAAAAREGGGNLSSLMDARAVAEARVCMVRVPGAPLWASIENDGHLTSLDDLDLTHLATDCGPYRPRTILRRECAGSQVVVLDRGSVVALDVSDGSLRVRALLTVGQGDVGDEALEDLERSVMGVQLSDAQRLSARGDGFVVTGPAEMPDEELVYTCRDGQWQTPPAP